MCGPRSLLLAVLMVSATSAEAAHAWRCVDARGSVSFQDHRCGAGQTERVVPLADDVAAPEPEPANDPIADETDTPPAPAPPTPRIAAPTFFVCIRFDGSRYRNETGIGASRLVPFGAQGELQGDLASAYGGRNGIGVSAPGLRSPPNVPSSLGNAYTRADDQCHHAGPREACTFLRKELDDVEDRLKRAFSDTESTLKQQQVELRDQLRGC
ncbi:MAG: DUF4124 domain-containing protein [Dokdonella sp.]|uniref:DUF4124 domain-containing protein n=1 Tax=Dokdonella sp. TaxID=2291710 RepID=UPI00326592B4